MDAETGAILALQILALCSIVAALLAYLMRQSRNATDEYESRNKRHVLVTSCDTCVGLQIALALYEVGYKVFAGLLDPSGSSPSIKILRAMEEQKDKDEDTVDAAQGNPQDPEVRARGQIVPLELDPTREDSLRACLDAVRAKLPAGEDGLWAVVHTGGQALPGVIERQPSSAWESMLRHNLVAPLRTARVFIPLLRAKRGRIVLLGDSATSYGTKAGTGLVAYSASRKAVEGAAEALKSELQSSGVDVVLLKPPPVGRGIRDLFIGRDLDSSCVNPFGPELADSSVNIRLSTRLLRYGSEIAALLPMIWLLAMLPAHVALHTRLN